MVVLDTNVISEMMKSPPANAVVHWYKTMSRRVLYTTAITCGEILAGIEMMPKGRKRTGLAREAHAMFGDEFENRILVFDQRAAEHYADIVGTRKRLGRRIEPIDAQIAAIARAHGMGLATRNVTHFADCSVDIVNPWST